MVLLVLASVVTIHILIFVIVALDLFIIFESEEILELREVTLMSRHEIINIIEGVAREVAVLSEESFISLLGLCIARQ